MSDILLAIQTSAYLHSVSSVSICIIIVTVLSSGSYPVPESMKGEYDINPAWADKTQEDLEQ